jgi:hypothetical protein
MARLSLFMLAVSLAGCNNAKLPIGGAQSRIGPVGGTVLVADGTRVVVPPGALQTETLISITPVATLPGALPASAIAIGPAYQMAPSGQVFSLPVTVVLAVGTARIPAGRALAEAAVYGTGLGTPATFDPPLPTAVFDATHVQTAEVTHFSTFVAGISEMAPIDMPPMVGCTPTGGTHRNRYVINTKTLPLSRSDFAFDLNGDGKIDNQYGNIIGATQAQNIMAAELAQGEVTSGNDLQLLDVFSVDGTFASDACAASNAFAAVKKASPDFSGVGAFTVDPAVATASFRAPIVAGTLISESPVTTVSPVILPVILNFMGASVRVNLVGARITWKFAGTGLMQGQINGAIPSSEMQLTVMPAVAAALTAKITANPSSSESLQLLSIFDTGGENQGCSAACNNVNATAGEPACGTKMNGKIETCEIATNAIIKNVLAPDVQMYQGGIYMPSSANVMKDCVSVGFGFTAARATF